MNYACNLSCKRGESTFISLIFMFFTITPHPFISPSSLFFKSYFIFYRFVRTSYRLKLDKTVLTALSLNFPTIYRFCLDINLWKQYGPPFSGFIPKNVCPCMRTPCHYYVISYNLKGIFQTSSLIFMYVC